MFEIFSAMKTTSTAMVKEVKKGRRSNKIFVEAQTETDNSSYLIFRQCFFSDRPQAIVMKLL